jgi:hypothetical protein
MDRLRRGHDRHPDPLRRLRQFTRTGIAIPVPTATPAETALAISASALRAEITASATAAATGTSAAAGIASIIPPRLAPLIPTPPVVAVATLAGSFVITALR